MPVARIGIQQTKKSTIPDNFKCTITHIISAFVHVHIRHTAIYHFAAYHCKKNQVSNHVCKYLCVL